MAGAPVRNSMKRFFPIVALAVGCAEPVMAQQPTDTMLLRRIMTLEAHVAQLQMMVGVQNFNKAQIPCGAAMEAARPTFTFINGEYDLAYRNRQFGCAFDPLVRRVTALESATPTAPAPNDGLQAQVTGALARIAAIESAVAGGQPVGTAVFDQIRAKRICLGDADCDPDWNAHIQIHGLGLANIGLASNLGKLDGQDPNHVHYSQFSLSTDGGPRIQQNVKSTFSRGFVSYVNPCREWLNFGPDSRGSVSIYVGGVSPSADAINNVECVPLPHDGAQDFVFKVDEARRRSQIIITRPNWQLEWVYSSALHAVDIVVPQPPPHQ